MRAVAGAVGVRAVAGAGALVMLTGAVLSIGGCTATTRDPSAPTVTVTVTSDGCRVSPSTVESGTVAFDVVNASDEVASVRVRGEEFAGGISNIAPGISRELVIDLAAGDYEAECTPGPAAHTYPAAFTATGAGATLDPASTAGVSEAYAAWVSETATELRHTTDALAVAFVDADPEARQLYREARALWASLRPALYQFPELLPAIDARESDLVAGERLSGWHAIEKDLWPPSTTEPDYLPLDAVERAELSSRLQTDLAELLDRVDAAPGLEAVEIAAGAQDLMDAASRALADNDERWSHAELSLVQGDLDGTIAAVDALREPLAQDAAGLLATIDEGTATLQSALDDEAGSRAVAIAIDSLATALSEARTVIAREAARIEP